MNQLVKLGAGLSLVAITACAPRYQSGKYQMGSNYECVVSGQNVTCQGHWDPKFRIELDGGKVKKIGIVTLDDIKSSDLTTNNGCSFSYRIEDEIRLPYTKQTIVSDETYRRLQSEGKDMEGYAQQSFVTELLKIIVHDLSNPRSHYFTNNQHKK